MEYYKICNENNFKINWKLQRKKIKFLIKIYLKNNL